MAVCTLVKLEAYRDRGVTCEALLWRPRVGQRYYGMAGCRSPTVDAVCCAEQRFASLTASFCTGARHCLNAALSTCQNHQCPNEETE